MFGYFITTLAAIFWVFRVIVALMYTAEAEFPIVPINMTFEIIMLFVTFVCIILVAKRKMIGAVVYLIAQCAYFGVDAYKSIETIIEGQPQTANYITLFISIIYTIPPSVVLNANFPLKINNFTYLYYFITIKKNNKAECARNSEINIKFA